MNKLIFFTLLLLSVTSVFSRTIEFEETLINEPVEQTGDAVYSETGNANEYLDQLLKNLGPVIQEKRLDPLALPSLKKSAEKMIGLIKIHGGFQVTQNRLRGLKTLHRAGDATLKFEDNVMKIQATLGINNMHISGNAMAWFGAIRKPFAVAGSIEYVSATIHLEMPMTDGGKPKATLLQINQLGKVKLDVKDLGPLNWVINGLGSMVVNMIKGIFKDKLSAPLLNLINSSLDKFPIFGA